MVAFAVMALTLAAASGPSEGDVLAYGKRLNVHRIDSRLASERYQAWLVRTLGRGATITWRSDDCGEGRGGYENVPVCFSAEARLRPRGRVFISIGVGSTEQGLRGGPGLFFGIIEGLGPAEYIKPGDLPLLASKVRTAQALGGELSRRPDVPVDDDAWIRQIQEMPAARFVPGAPGDGTFGDWLTRRAGSRPKVEWFIDGCGNRGKHGGTPVDLTGDKDEWAFVDAELDDPDVHVLTRIRIGTCRKGTWGEPIVSLVQLFNKRRGHTHTEQVSLDVLETKLREIRAIHQDEPPAK